MRRELDVSEIKAATTDIKERAAKIHNDRGFDMQMAQWLENFHKNFMLYSYLRKFCYRKKSEKSHGESKELLVKKILYVIYTNHKATNGKFGTLLRYTVGVYGSEYMSDIGLNKYDYIIMDMVGLDIMKKFNWDKNYNLTYGFNKSAVENRLYIRGEPEVIGIETDTPKFLYKNDKF